MEHDEIIVHCPTEADAHRLLNYLHQNGVRWSDGSTLPSQLSWSRYREETCYRCHNNLLLIGRKGFYETDDEFSHIQICRVEDVVDYPDFEVASDDMLKELLSI